MNTLDKLVHEYCCSRQTNTCRWPNEIFFNMVDIGAYNALVIFTKKNGNVGVATRSKRLYLELSKALCRPNIQRHLQTPQLPVKLRNLILNVLDQLSDSPTLAAPAQVEEVQSQGRCVLCPQRKLVHRQCTNCRPFISPNHAFYSV